MEDRRFTEVDLRRMLEKNGSLDLVTAKDIMSVNPKTIGPNELAVQALDELRKYSITQLAVTTHGQYLANIHLHDLIREGLI